ncbi:MAG TPA: tol-pal system-associated acyl-CoA thioesterase [Burkholderiaceae bacterium]|nr:tol-pal system-associated acyl-CoA thioesterase [Burkholderiaceae bacterium]
MSTLPASATGQPFTWTVRVYYEDTDTGGIVYYANYLKFFERARTEWLRAAGFEQQRLLDEFGLQFVVAHIACDYRQPARLDDLIDIDLRIGRAARVSIVFEQTARRGGTVLATATVKAACVDARQLAPKAMPAAMMAAFRTLPGYSSPQ